MSHAHILEYFLHLSKFAAWEVYGTLEYIYICVYIPICHKIGITMCDVMMALASVITSSYGAKGRSMLQVFIK